MDRRPVELRVVQAWGHRSTVSPEGWSKVPETVGILKSFLEETHSSAETHLRGLGPECP